MNLVRRLLPLIALSLCCVLRVGFADPFVPVTACASDTQTGAGENLAHAISKGGEIRFQCPVGTILRITSLYTLTADTSFDGANTVTFDGHGLIGPFLSSGARTLVVGLYNLQIQGFALRPPGAGIGRERAGSVVHVRGSVELRHVTITTSDVPIAVQGSLTISQSSFIGNRGGLTVSADAAIHISRSNFSGNLHEVLLYSGWIHSSSFNNQTNSAVTVAAARGPVEILHCTFTGIRGGPALLLDQQSASGGSQVITVRANTFSNNDGASAGGAIAFQDIVEQARQFGQSQAVLDALSKWPPSQFAFSYNRFLGNHGARAGAIAADLAHTSGLSSYGDLFFNNRSDAEGGAVRTTGNSITITHALMKGNQSAKAGAALWVAPDAQAVVANSLIAENTGPEAALSGTRLHLANVTIANNASSGLSTSAAGRAANVILAHNRPSDCVGAAPTFEGGGLQSDGTCGSLTVGDAFLDPSYIPAANSPALTLGLAGVCNGDLVQSRDLLFQKRAQPDVCALGAFERPPLQPRQLPALREARTTHANIKEEFGENDGYRAPAVGSADLSTVVSVPHNTIDPSARPREINPRHAPLDPAIVSTLTAMLAAEHNAPAERVRLFVVRGATADDYYLDRLAPDRSSLLVNPAQGGPAVIRIGNQQWARTGVSASWLAAPFTDRSDQFSELNFILQNSLRDASASALPGGGQRIEGTLGWANGAACEGRLLLKTDPTGLPSFMGFDGRCDAQPFRFREAFSFTSNFQITPPRS